MRYTYSDDEDGSDALSSRRSARNSGISTPLETGPTVTASGRQVKSRVGGVYGESMLTDQRKEWEKAAGEAAGEGHFTETSEDMPTTVPNGLAARISRSGRAVKPVREKYAQGIDSDSDEAQSSGKEWSGNEDEQDESEPDFDAEDEDEDEDMSDEALEADELEEDDNTQESLVVQLRYRKGKEAGPPSPVQPRPPQQIANGGSVNGSAQSQAAGKPPQAPAEETMMDTIDVIPRTRAMNGSQSIPNGLQGAGNNIAPPPQPAFHIAIQPMDLA